MNHRTANLLLEVSIPFSTNRRRSLAVFRSPAHSAAGIRPGSVGFSRIRKDRNTHREVSRRELRRMVRAAEWDSQLKGEGQNSITCREGIAGRVTMDEEMKQEAAQKH